ncbi:MAG: InlB B-repeat-containing protein [Bacteroidetes bacterium]|nr:InlB B-repeat-containing protein [Bacteroidota bacterium]MCL2303483.1 InlB B-repeat-containing protein [Lentimicrobiaceae bacterium]
MHKTLLNSFWLMNAKRKTLVQILMVFMLLLGVFALQAQNKHYVAGNMYIDTAGFVYIISGDTVILEKTIKTVKDTAATKRGVLSLAGTAGWKSSNSSFVNGYVRTRNAAAFIFPVGQSVYRPVAISAAAPDTPADAAYYETALFDINSLGDNVDVITNESWIIQGTKAANITLSWSTDMTVFASNNIANIFVVGWDPITNKWEKIASTIDPVSIFGISSSLSSGSVTTLAAIVPNSYAAYTLGGYQPYTVTFNDNGDINTRVTMEGDSIGSANMPDEPTRNCYEFKNWYFDLNDENSLFTGATVVTSDTTVYAKWIDLRPAAPVIIDAANNHICEGEQITTTFLTGLVSTVAGTTLEFYTDAACTTNFTSVTATVPSHTFYVLARNSVTGCVTSPSNALPLTITVNSCVTLDLKLFLQGSTQNGNYTFKGEAKNGPYMTNHIQIARYQWFVDLELPIDNPYGLPGSYPRINDTEGPAYEVVDWILVEIWSNFNESTYTYDSLEARALLLQVDGSVVDVNGELPKFNIQQDDVRIVVRHRNHLTVASSIELPFSISGIIEYDFSTGIDKAYTLPFPGVPNQMTMKHGVACLWAGSLKMDHVLNATDINIFNNYFYFVSGSWIYTRSDLDKNGIVDGADSALILDNFYLRSVYSVLRFFTKNN